MSIKVVNNVRKVFKNITDDKAIRFVNSVISTGMAQSRFYAPIAYSALINSQYSNITKTATGIRGEFGFMQNYSIHLNGDGTYIPKWKPVKAPKYQNSKRGAAPGDNMRAKPGFLTTSLDSPEAKKEIQQAYDIFRK